MLLYIQWQSQLSSQPSTHSFHFRMSISNTSVKCSSYIYLYIMKELKMLFFRTIYSIMNSNRQENINRIMKQTPPPEFPSWPGGPVSHPDSSTTWSKQTQVTVSCCSHSTTIKKKPRKMNSTHLLPPQQMIWVVISGTSRNYTSHTMSQRFVKRVNNVVYQYKDRIIFLQELSVGF